MSVSEDGLHWEPKQTWAWDDGTQLEMSTTQQHWLTHSDGLFSGLHARGRLERKCHSLAVTTFCCSSRSREAMSDQSNRASGSPFGR